MAGLPQAKVVRLLFCWGLSMKRAIVILLVPLLLASWASMAIMRGDVSGDGRIDLADTILSVQGVVTSVDHAGETSLATSLNAAIAAFRAVAGLSSHLRDDNKNSQINQGATLVLGPSPLLQTSLYQPISYISISENTHLSSTILDSPTPPPEFA
jgi:hypothetical protein